MKLNPDIYPYLCVDYLHVERAGFHLPVTFVIYDFEGRKIRKGMTESNIQTSGLPGGIYIIKLIQERSSRVFQLFVLQ